MELSKTVVTAEVLTKLPVPINPSFAANLLRTLHPVGEQVVVLIFISAQLRNGPTLK